MEEFNLIVDSMSGDLVSLALPVKAILSCFPVYACKNNLGVQVEEGTVKNLGYTGRY